MINELIGHFEEKNENKYDENKEASKKYEDVWESIKKDIEKTNDGERVEYGKEFKKIRFESDDDLPMNKRIKLHLLTIMIRCLFSEDGKFYPQSFLDDALYKLV